MQKARVTSICCVLLLLIFPLFVSWTCSQETSVQFSLLQDVINKAEAGSKIYVAKDTYYGVIKINKTLTLIADNAILDANGEHVGVIISASNVRLEGFEIQNAVRFGNGSIPEDVEELWLNPEMEGAGIYVYWANGVVISNITISGCYAGIGFTHSSATLSNSTVNKTLWGVMLYCSDIAVFNSNIMNGLREYTTPDGRDQTGGGGIVVHHYSRINMTYSTLLNTNWAMSISPYAHYSYINYNNFINNTHQICIHPEAQWEVANWSSNYWSDYVGVDLCCGLYQNETGSDGFGDTPYVIDYYNQDNYPLMEDPQLNQPKPKVFRREGGRGFSKPLCT